LFELNLLANHASDYGDPNQSGGKPIVTTSWLIAEAWDAAGLCQVRNFIGDSWREWNGHFRDDFYSFFRGDDGSAEERPSFFLAPWHSSTIVEMPLPRLDFRQRFGFIWQFRHQLKPIRKKHLSWFTRGVRLGTPPAISQPVSIGSTRAYAHG
jgi:hypothetical protein